MENAFFVPVLPDKRDALLAFANALQGEKKPSLDLAQTTVTKESWFLQDTPMGAFIIVYTVAPDPHKVHKALADCTDEFDMWFKEQVKDCTGVDLSLPIEQLPSQILSWSR